jgi:Ca2+-binding EF-hand superfamily protein
MLRAMRSLGMESKNKKLVGNIDNHIISKTEGDGRMNFEEFLDIVAQNMHDNLTKEDTNRVFDFIDRDRNGRISIKDLKTTAQELGEELSGSHHYLITQLVSIIYFPIRRFRLGAYD